MQVTVPIVDGIAFGMGTAAQAATTMAMTMTTMAAENFYVPETVPMGTAEAPVEMVVDAVPVGEMEVYYYQPEVMEPGDPGYVAHGYVV